MSADAQCAQREIGWGERRRTGEDAWLARDITSFANTDLGTVKHGAVTVRTALMLDDTTCAPRAR